MNKVPHGYNIPSSQSAMESRQEKENKTKGKQKPYLGFTRLCSIAVRQTSDMLHTREKKWEAYGTQQPSCRRLIPNAKALREKPFAPLRLCLQRKQLLASLDRERLVLVNFRLPVPKPEKCVLML